MEIISEIIGWFSSIIKLIVKFFIILFIIVLITPRDSQILFLPFLIIVTVIAILYSVKFGTLKDLCMKYKIRKDYGTVMLLEKINLFKTHHYMKLEEENRKVFDKSVLEYKKHYICFTKNGILFIGYSPISKEKEIPKVYKKEFKLDNIDGIELYYRINKYTSTHNETKTTYRTITNSYGMSHTEEIRENVPVQSTHTSYNMLYGCIYFKNVLAQRVYFDFSSKGSFKLARKTAKICSKLGIKGGLVNEQD